MSSIAASGAGYVVGDVIPVAGGTVGERLTPASIEVTAINGSGGVTGARLFEPRSYIVAPSNPVATSGGTGSGATFNLTWSNATSEQPSAVVEASHGWKNGVDLTQASFSDEAFASPGFAVDGTGAASVSGLVIAGPRTPASSSTVGAAGSVCWDASYLYVCVAANSWKRVALSTF